MQVTAKLRHFRMAPRKVRLVADVMRGQDVEDAVKQLSFRNKKVAGPLLKLLNSAIANGVNNFKLKKDNLYISELRVDEGPTLKRWMPRAMGRATPINKRTSHISLVLDEKIKTLEKIKKEDKKKDKDKDIKVVKNFEELKELEKEMDKDKGNLPIDGEDDWSTETKELKPKIKDVRMEGSDRGKQHLDKIRKKEKGGGIKKFFRRKSV